MSEQKAPKVTIMLSADELNKFLGGDSEAAIKLKNHIVQEFSRKYLKSLVDDKLEKMGRRVLMEAAEQFAAAVSEEVVGTFTGSLRLKPSMRELIKSAATLEVSKALHAMVSTTVQKLLLDKEGDIARFALYVARDSILKEKKSGIIKKIEAGLDKLLTEEDIYGS